MGLFSKLKKQKRVLIDDRYTVFMSLDDDYRPENNDKVKSIINDLSKSDEDNGEKPLNKTLPFATFKSAEDFLGDLRNLAATESTSIPFKYFAIWEFDKDQKPKPGKPGSPNGNPHEFITLPDFSISYDYENLTRVLFESIFNNPENDEVSYEEKKTICEGLKQAYMESLGVDEKQVALIPSEAEVAKGAVELAIPAYSDVDVKNQNDMADNSNNQNNPIYDPDSHTISNQTPNNDTGEEKNLDSQNGVISLDENNEPITPNSAKQIQSHQSEDKPANEVRNIQSSTPKRESRTTKRTIRDEVSEETEEAREKGHVNAPQFSIKELDPVDPGQHGYVEYQMNQQRKTYNKYLKNLANQLNHANEKAILSQQEKYRKAAQEAIKQFKNAHKNDEDLLFDHIQAVVKADKDEARKKEFAKIEAQKQIDLANAKRAYEKQKEEISHNAQVNKDQSETDLTKEYTKKAEQRFNKEAEQLKKDNAKELSKLEKELDRKYSVKSREDAAQARVNATAKLQESLSHLNRELAQYQKKVTAEHLNAKQTVIAEQRAETENKRIGAPYQELRESQKDLDQAHSQLSKITAERDSLEKQVNDQKITLESMNSKLDALQKENSALHKEAISKQVSKEHESNSSMLSQYLQVQLAKEMNQNSSTQHQETKVDQENEQLKTVIKGTKRLTYGFVAALLLVIGGGAGLMIHQQNMNNERYEALTKTMNQRVAAAKATSTKPQLSQEQIDHRATNALHANDGKKLDKYNTEKYYELDKAIIDNNSDAANKAVQGLGDNLNMGDRYRASQAVELLKNANNNDLANKVSDANK